MSRKHRKKDPPSRKPKKALKRYLKKIAKAIFSRYALTAIIQVTAMFVLMGLNTLRHFVS